jgi:antitoxin component YwqK of YwqJK toxin-antitoxin module
VKTWITVLCAVALLAGAEKKDAPKVVVDFDQLEFRDRLQYFEGKPFTGVAVEKHDNGQKQYEGTWKDGKLHGLSTNWYKDGQKGAEATHKDGNPVTGIVWKPNGEKCPVTNIPRERAEVARNQLEGRQKDFL